MGARAQVGWIDSAVTLTDGGGNKDIKLKVNTGSIFLQTNNSSRLIVADGGNVGIGTTSPSAKFEVFSTTTNKFVRFRADNNEQRFEFYVGASGNASRMSMHNDAATETIRFASAANSYLNGGNVGIGTTSPESKLTIKGDPNNTDQPVRITNSIVDAKTGLFINGTGNSPNQKYGMQFGGYNQYSIGGIFGVLDSVSGSTSGDITFDFGNGTASGALVERMRITHEGNVGIGTTTPSHKIDINQGELRILNNQLDPQIILQGSDMSKRWVLSQDEEDNIGSTGFYIAEGTNVDANDALLYLTPAGELGIGTTSPSAKLHATGSSSSGNLPIAKIESTGNVSYLKFFNSSTGTGSSDGTYIGMNGGTAYLINKEAGNLYLGTGDDINLTLQNGGNVGIGTTSPGSPLVVKGTDVGATDNIAVQNSAGTKTFSVSNNGQVNIDGSQKIVTSDASIELRNNATGLMSIKSASNYGITFGDNGGETMRISTSTNNVGIGTTSPTQKLHVDGNTLISAEKYYYTAGTGAGFGSDASGNFKIRQNDADLIFGSGNSVGIGTNSPNRLLHLLTTTTDETQQLLIQNGHSGDAAIMFNISGDTYSLGIDNSDGDKFKLSYGNLGVNDRIVIDSTGNVGIGTTSPGRKLTIGNANGSVNNQLSLLDGGGTEQATISVETPVANDLLIASKANLRIFTGSTIGNATTLPTNERMRITSAGNVGIGTNSPNFKLDVNGDVRIEEKHNLFFGGTGSTDPNWGMNNNQSADFTIFEGSSGARFVIENGGNVGIGTTNPSQKLEVDGQVLSDGYRLAAMQTAPAARNSTGTLGEIVIDGNHIYVCYATNSWSRVALETSW